MKYNGRTSSVCFTTISTLIALHDLVATFFTRLNILEIIEYNRFILGALIVYHCSVKIPSFRDLRDDRCAKVEGKRRSSMIEQAPSLGILDCQRTGFYIFRAWQAQKTASTKDGDVLLNQVIAFLGKSNK